MKEDFAFITIIITVYHFWMYSHLVSFKCKSGHWTAHVVTHGSLTMMIHSGIGRENRRAPLLSLRENNWFDLCLFSWKPCTQQNKKKPWDSFYLRQKVDSFVESLVLCVSFLSFAQLKSENREVQSAAQDQGWTEAWGEVRSPHVREKWDTASHAMWWRLLRQDLTHCASVGLEDAVCC